ncbi:MAG: SCO6745 family protein, partial [Acidimicrobiales bacterium]
MRDDEVSVRARALGGALEPIAGQVYFSPECHSRYEKLGFGASPGAANGVALPDGPAYFCSRGSVMGQVPGELISAAFAVFNPAAVVPSVAFGWALTDAATICEARTAGATEQLVRILGEQPSGIDVAIGLLDQANQRLRPEGRPLYSGLLSLGLPGNPMGDLWRLADRLREYRGDAHTAAWTAAGFDATEIGMLSELYWGLPSRSYVRTRAWSDADLDAAAARLGDRGLLADGAMTDQGRTEREEVELATDRQCRPIVEALGDDFDALIATLLPWGA